ncbi:hypothetical protein ACFL1S_05700 [Pseudomonadota bacterium]
MKVFYSLDKLIEHANTVLDGKDVVSLDIFDTLFVRRIYEPDLVKFPVARFVAEKAAIAGIATTWKQVHALRNEIEAAQRAKNGAAHPDHEANYDDFMPEMLRQIFGAAYDDTLFDSVADYEMEMETAVLAPRTALVEWMAQLHRRHIGIILISDIYLPAKYLRRLIENKGLAEYVTDVISSADTFRAKASGTGFDIVREKHDIDPGRWLHVGDNPISDGLRPTEAGIEALLIQDIGERQRKGVARLIHCLAGIRHVWKGRNVRQIMSPLESDNAEYPELYVDGHNSFGMLIGYFLQRLAEKCRQRNIRRIYFCSREGWLFFECWKRMAPYLFAGTDPPEASYLHVSRIALSGAACANAGLTPANATVALLPLQNTDFLDICRVYGLDIETLRPCLDRAGLLPDEQITPVAPDASIKSVNPDNPFSVLLADPAFQDEVRRQGLESRQLFDAYLESEGFFNHQDVALVDIGWLGTIQHYLHQAISHRDQRPNIHGFMLAATRMVPYPESSRNHFEGLVFDQREFSLATSFVLTIKDVLEEICRAPHTSVIGYERSGDRVRPRLRDASEISARSEMKQSDYYAPMHEGILAGTGQYAMSVTLLGYESGHIRAWLNFQLVTELAFPSARAVKRIRHFHHHDDFAGTREVKKDFIRHYQTLWDIDTWKIALIPFTRFRYYFRHLSRMLRLLA